VAWKHFITSSKYASHIVKRPLFVPVFLFVCSAVAFGLGILFRARALPFLHSDTILSAGREVSTNDFARFMSRAFYVAGAATIGLGLATLLSLLRAKRKNDDKGQI
jgi:hypothetical protein